MFSSNDFFKIPNTNLFSFNDFIEVSISIREKFLFQIYFFKIPILNFFSNNFFKIPNTNLFSFNDFLNVSNGKLFFQDFLANLLPSSNDFIDVSDRKLLFQDFL